MTTRVAPLLALLWIGPAAAAPRTFAIDGHASKASARVGKTGVGSFAGHEHEIVAPAIRGEIVADLEDLPRSTVNISIGARALKVSEQGEPHGDAPKVEQAMRGPKVLDVGRFAVIHFVSREVQGKLTAPGSYDLLVAGDLSLRGVVKPFKVPVHLEVRGDSLTASGKMVVKQTDFGIEPTSAAGGMVRVEDEVALQFEIAARASKP